MDSFTPANLISANAISSEAAAFVSRLTWFAPLSRSLLAHGIVEQERHAFSVQSTAAGSTLAIIPAGHDDPL